MLNSAPNPWPCLVFCFFLTSPTSPTSGWDLTWSNASPLRWFHRAVSPDRSRLFGSFAPQMCSCSALMPSRARVQALPRWSSEISWISSNTATAQCPDWNDLHLSWTNVCICIWYTYMYMIYIYVCVYIRMCLCIYIYIISFGYRYLYGIEKNSVTAHLQNLQMSVGNPLLFIPWVGLTGHCLLSLGQSVKGKSRSETTFCFH